MYRQNADGNYEQCGPPMDLPNIPAFRVPEQREAEELDAIAEKWALSSETVALLQDRLARCVVGRMVAGAYAAERRGRGSL